MLKHLCIAALTVTLLGGCVPRVRIPRVAKPPTPPKITMPPPTFKPPTRPLVLDPNVSIGVPAPGVRSPLVRTPIGNELVFPRHRFVPEAPTVKVKTGKGGSGSLDLPADNAIDLFDNDDGDQKKRSRR
jgi:hypothetical protein